MFPSTISSTPKDNPDITILGLPYDKTASFRKGARNGPAKITECLRSQIEIFDPFQKKSTSRLLKIAYEEAKNLPDAQPEEAFEIIRSTYRDIRNKCPFIFVAGGEHSVTIGSLAALKEFENSKDVTILHIDAHLDLRNDDSDYSENPTKYAHSAVMRRASEFGYNIVSVGIRAFSEEEYSFAKNHKNTIRLFEWKDGVPKIQKILRAIKTKKVYISIDVDGIDPAHMPGTGTPVQGGLEWYYFLDLMKSTIEKFHIVGADIVEVAPEQDNVSTEYGAAQIIYTMLGHIHAKEK